MGAGRYEEARRTLQEALVLVLTTDERFYEAELYRLRGEVALNAGEPVVQAREDLEQALAISRRQGSRSLELRALMSLARQQHLLGNDQRVAQHLRTALSAFTQGLNTPDLVEARQLLELPQA
jgi:tetratricopeptide (TPR) repeat protein